MNRKRANNLLGVYCAAMLTVAVIALLWGTLEADDGR